MPMPAVRDQECISQQEYRWQVVNDGDDKTAIDEHDYSDVDEENHCCRSRNPKRSSLAKADERRKLRTRQGGYADAEHGDQPQGSFACGIVFRKETVGSSAGGCGHCNGSKENDEPVGA